MVISLGSVLTNVVSVIQHDIRYTLGPPSNRIIDTFDIECTNKNWKLNMAVHQPNDIFNSKPAM